ncbi:MAG: DNA repair protein RecO [Erysipelothrix sp.]|nr:DNA repair protein RecO [Erysipelothrix sp.]
MSKLEVLASALILRQTDYKDNDAIILALSEQGEFISLYARGIKKSMSKNAGGLQAMTFSQLTYFEKTKGLHLLKSAKYINSYVKDLNDYDQMMTAFILVEIITNIQRYQVENNPEIYQAITQALSLLNQVDNTLIIAKLLVIVLELNGQKLIADACAKCGDQKVNYISSDYGGFVCYECLVSNDVEVYSLEVMKLFRYVNKTDLLKLKNNDFKDNDLLECLKIIYSFYNTYTGEYLSNIKHFIDVE